MPRAAMRAIIIAHAGFPFFVTCGAPIVIAKPGHFFIRFGSESEQITLSCSKDQWTHLETPRRPHMAPSHQLSVTSSCFTRAVWANTFFVSNVELTKCICIALTPPA